MRVYSAVGEPGESEIQKLVRAQATDGIVIHVHGLMGDLVGGQQVHPGNPGRRQGTLHGLRVDEDQGARDTVAFQPLWRITEIRTAERKPPLGMRAPELNQPLGQLGLKQWSFSQKHFDVG
jgi:hypothetical protein